MSRLLRVETAANTDEVEVCLQHGGRSSIQGKDPRNVTGEAAVTVSE